MDFADRVDAIASRIPDTVAHLQTEEATKNALVMPFLNALGYNVFDPLEVIPEYTADVGTKKGEKVDYAIMRDREPIILVECKKAGTDLTKVTPSQLYRYFSVTTARIGILTDGVVYHFFSDLEEPNKMDQRPFLVFDMRSWDEPMIHELKRFTKSGFDLETMLTAAVELKYTRAIKKLLADELQSPSEDLVRFFASRVYDGRMTQSVKEQFTGITKRALYGFINDRIADRLKHALGDPSRDDSVEVDPEGSVIDLPDGVVQVDGDIITTQDELDGYLIIKAILRDAVDPTRVSMRDTKSYCGILLDDNNRKPICRLHFNGKSKKYIGLFDGDKRETRVLLETLDDIYRHADRIRETVGYYAEPMDANA